ncbi:hypothetical protein E4T38_00782 [Aureobasidium subglaciale]|nr:hypothetical protein E4T38_00782 [Aureobasidium subglaciale]KAI5231206.1 hypothetical protein E4T40_00783 [Aureobasidium subglaciale]KAI5234046.1 hypothetical protein E4T41_00781 [Aureobasidium subglaciale]KAI5267654.1 hypothetical protein E4T46_00781 [Aureobasidium subglaciale]
MSDALCGPSNAVQNLAKHSSVDRTLQQDRLVSRQSPSEAFRSYDPNVSSLDPEFEAFQNGGPAFAGPSWAASSFSHLQAQPQPSFQPFSPSPPAAWTQDFQRLAISSPQQTQLHAAPQAWHNHFGQHAHHSAPSHASPSHMQMPSARLQSPHIFGPMQAAPHYASQFLDAHQQRLNLPQDHFDEAAFEAAFDAALQDASLDQDFAMQENDNVDLADLDDVDFDSFLTDIYPHLPLFRLVLANALVTNTDESLHRAAKIVAALIQHPQTMHPIQAMLFRPLLSALNDPKRSLFSQRYGFEPALNEMLDCLAQQTENTRLNIDAPTERLLASYADLLWQRNESNHSEPTDVPRSADNAYWLDNFFHDEGITSTQNITQHSANILSESLNRQVLTNHTSQALNRVLDIEYEVYSKRSAVSNMSVQQPTSTREKETVLFDMMDHVLAAPETIEALEAVTSADSFQANTSQEQNSRSANHALQDYQTQLMLLEQQNVRRRRLEAERLYKPALEDDMLDDSTNQQPEELNQDQKDLDRQNDDELAQTAANLLERVSDNQSSKFKNSAFLGLMRQLADREIRVEGDKMVPTNMSETLGHDRPAASVAQDGQDVIDILNQPGSLADQG